MFETEFPHHLLAINKDGLYIVIENVSVNDQIKSNIGFAQTKKWKNGEATIQFRTSDIDKIRNIDTLLTKKEKWFDVVLDGEPIIMEPIGKVHIKFKVEVV